jgi:hypothetical protein
MEGPAPESALAIPQTDARARQTQSAARKTQSVVGKTQSVVGKTQSVVGKTQSVVGKTQGAARKTQGAARKTQGAARKTQGAARKTKSVVRKMVGNITVGYIPNDCTINQKDIHDVQLHKQSDAFTTSPIRKVSGRSAKDDSSKEASVDGLQEGLTVRAGKKVTFPIRKIAARPERERLPSTDKPSKEGLAKRPQENLTGMEGNQASARGDISRTWIGAGFEKLISYTGETWRKLSVLSKHWSVSRGAKSGKSIKELPTASVAQEKGQAYEPVVDIIEQHQKSRVGRTQEEPAANFVEQQKMMRAGKSQEEPAAKLVKQPRVKKSSKDDTAKLIKQQEGSNAGMSPKVDAIVSQESKLKIQTVKAQQLRITRRCCLSGNESQF